MYWQHILKYRHHYCRMEYTMDVITHKKVLLTNIKENVYMYEEVLTFVDRVTVTSAPLAARCVGILRMN
jgi:hypothetical protein